MLYRMVALNHLVKLSVPMGTQGECSFGHTKGSVAMGTQRECSYGHTEGSVVMGTQGGV